jgi:hypothetical protein
MVDCSIKSLLYRGIDHHYAPDFSTQCCRQIGYDFKSAAYMRWPPMPEHVLGIRTEIGAHGSLL